MSDGDSSSNRIRLELKGVNVVSIDNVAAFESVDDFAALLKITDTEKHFATPNFVFNGDGALVGGDWRIEGRTAPTLLSLASPERAQQARAAFEVALQRLYKAASSKRKRALVESAVNVSSADEVLLQHDTLVLANWGLVPADIATTDERLAYRREIIGVETVDTQSRPGIIEPNAAADLSSNADNTSQRSLPRSVWPIAIGAAILAILLIPGVLLRDSDSQAIEPILLDNKNTIEQLRVVLDEQKRKQSDFECPVASIDPQTGEQALTSSVLLSRRDLRAHAEQGTVLVVVDGGTKIGTGFFVSSSEILTNAHVVDGAKSVSITSKKLGGMLDVDVVYQDYNDATGNDFALLNVTQSTAVKPLVLTTSLESSDDVFAAGFPGNMLSIEMKAQQQGGGVSSATMHFTPGFVSALPAANLQTAFISHTATLMGGNSGGPLMDRCGNVVGINTKVASDKRVNTAFGIALPVDRAKQFLDAAGSSVPATDNVCSVAGAP